MTRAQHPAFHLPTAARVCRSYLRTTRRSLLGRHAENFRSAAAGRITRSMESRRLRVSRPPHAQAPRQSGQHLRWRLRFVAHRAVETCQLTSEPPNAAGDRTTAGSAPLPASGSAGSTKAAKHARVPPHAKSRLLLRPQQSNAADESPSRILRCLKEFVQATASSHKRPCLWGQRAFCPLIIGLHKSIRLVSLV